MKLKDVAQLYVLETLIRASTGVGFNPVRAKNCGLAIEPNRGLQPREYDRVQELVQTEVKRYRDKLVKKGIVLDGDILPWEF